MAGYEAIGKKTIACATCDNWEADKRFPSRDRKDVLYETYQKGKCFGVEYRGEWTTPRFRCRDWKIWRKMNVRPKFQSDITEEARKARMADKSAPEFGGEEIDEKEAHRRDS